MSTEVAILTPTTSRLGGGLFDSIRKIGQELNARGEKITVLAPGDEFTEEDLSVWQPLRVRVFPRIGPRNFACGHGLSAALKASDARLAHTHGLWTHLSIVAHRWAAVTRRPIVVSPQGMLDPWSLEQSPVKKSIAASLYERRHLLKAACLHALTSKEMDECRRFGLTNPVCVIPNGVDLPTPDAGRDYRARIKKHLPEGKRVLLFLGRIHPKKGLLNTLRAFKILMTAAKDRALLEGWVLAIAGWDQGGHEAELRAFVAELELQHSVFFLGPVFGNERDGTYANSDAFILPSYGEGQPLAVLEAWAHGLPVLMTSACNLPEGIEHKAAIEINPEPHSIAGGLRQLFSSSELGRLEMGKCGSALAEQRFSWAGAAKQMQEVYRWIRGDAEKPTCVFTD